MKTIKHESINIAVLGCPNSGKSTLINLIAKSRLRVGNWPGVTVEKHEALLHEGDYALYFVDLPGTYGLYSSSAEEVVAQQYFEHERPNIIINVVDATQLERQLVLTFQLIEYGIPMMLVLTMADEEERLGKEIDIDTLGKLLGVSVIAINATRNESRESLIKKIMLVHQENVTPRPIIFSDDIESVIQIVSAGMTEAKNDLKLSRKKCIQLLEEDVSRLSREDQAVLEEARETKRWKHIVSNHSASIAIRLQEERWSQARGLARLVTKSRRASSRDWTQIIDQVALHPVAGMLVFLLSLWLLFKWTFFFSMPVVNFVGHLINGPISHILTELLASYGTSAWLNALIIDGMLGGVGVVFSFVPLILLLMIGITLFESSGYMARAAFVMDRWMHTVGLHGKSFIPLVMGFGCNVPAIYATRVLETRREKIITAMIIPLMSCSARMPVYALFLGVFFPVKGATIMWGLYLLGIFLAMLMSRFLSWTVFKEDAPLFIMDLPPYRWPTLRHLFVHAWEKVKHFINKAFSYILVASIISWSLFHLPSGADPAHSYLGQVSQTIAPIFSPLGFGTWEATAALITGVAAKEVILSTLTQVTQHEADTLALAIRVLFSPASALSFMVFVLLYVPCLVTAVAYKQELGSWKWFWWVVLYSATIAWVLAWIVYRGALWLI